MKNLLSIIVCALLLSGSASVYADAVPVPEGAPPPHGGVSVQEQVPRLPEGGIQGPVVQEVMEEEIRETPVMTPPAAQEEGGRLLDEDQVPVTDVGQVPEEIPPMLTGDSQQEGVDYCDGVQKIHIVAKDGMTAREVFEEELNKILNPSSMRRTACFEFESPIVLNSTLEILAPDTIVNKNIRLVGMHFEAAPDFAEAMRGGGGALVHVKSSAAKLELIDLDVNGYTTESPVRACLTIENSENVVVQRGEFRNCVVGVYISGSRGVHLGAYEPRFTVADGCLITDNLERGLFIEGSKNITHGMNIWGPSRGAVGFDWDKAVVIENSNRGVQPPDKMPLSSDDNELFMLLSSSEIPGNLNNLNMMFKNSPGKVDLYRITGDRVGFIGSCDLGEDHKCRAPMNYPNFQSGTRITAIYTASDLEETPEDESGSSEFMGPIDWDGGSVVAPTGEFVIATPSAESESDDVISGSAQMVGGEAGGGGAPAPKMCSLSVHTSASYSPLMWLFLSIGILGSVRFRRRK